MSTPDNTPLIAAVFNEDVQADVADACVLDTLDPASLISGPVTISRPAEPADYVTAIHARIDTFDGLTAADVTPAAVEAVLPTPEPEETV